MTTTRARIEAVAAGVSAALKAYADSVTAQVQNGKATLDQLEAQAKSEGATAELSVIERLKAAQQNISSKLQDLKATHKSNISRAQADIDTDVARLKAEIDEIGAKLKLQLSQE